MAIFDCEWHNLPENVSNTCTNFDVKSGLRVKFSMKIIYLSDT